MNSATAKSGNDTQMRFRSFFCSMPNISETMRRAQRNAVSPDVMAQPITPTSTRAVITGPMVVSVITFTILAALPPYCAMASLSPSTPPQKDIPMAAHIRATMLSAIIAP